MKAKRMTSKMRTEKWKQKSRSMVTSDRFGAPLSIQLFQFKLYQIADVPQRNVFVRKPLKMSINPYNERAISTFFLQVFAAPKQAAPSPAF